MCIRDRLTPRNSAVRNATCDDVAKISPELHKGLIGLKEMSHSMFAEYIEMEGLDASMSKENVSRYCPAYAI